MIVASTIVPLPRAMAQPRQMRVDLLEQPLAQTVLLQTHRPGDGTDQVAEVTERLLRASQTAVLLRGAGRCRFVGQPTLRRGKKRF